MYVCICVCVCVCVCVYVYVFVFVSNYIHLFSKNQPMKKTQKKSKEM